jgi:hypothetical protein
MKNKIMQHDERTCENSKPCFDCEYPLLKNDGKVKMPKLAKLFAKVSPPKPSNYPPNFNPSELDE